MHIPDSILDAKVIAATAAVGAAGLAIAVRKTERRLGDGTTVLMGTMAAFIFAAQMVNFPVLALCFRALARRRSGGRAAGALGGCDCDRGGAPGAVLDVCRWRPDGTQCQFREHGADRRRGRLRDLQTDSAGDRRSQGGLDRGDGRGLVFGAAGFGCLRSRAGGIRPRRRVPAAAGVDGARPRSDRNGRSSHYRRSGSFPAVAPA